MSKLLDLGTSRWQALSSQGSAHRKGCQWLSRISDASEFEARLIMLQSLVRPAERSYGTCGLDMANVAILVDYAREVTNRIEHH